VKPRRESGGRRGCNFEAAKLIVRFTEVIPGRVEAIPGVVARVMEIISEMECARGGEFEVELALTEALANAVRHGCGSDETKEVQVCAACDADRGVLLVVRDPGGGFDPASVPSPVLGQNVYATGGRGIFLINQLMDDVRYERGGTVIRMRKGAETESPR
jgi:serine/threonine-protein kinase RsbW